MGQYKSEKNRTEHCRQGQQKFKLIQMTLFYAVDQNSVIRIIHWVRPEMRDAQELWDIRKWDGGVQKARQVRPD